MQEVRDIDNHCLMTCQQRVSLYTLHLVWCWVLSIMSLTVTPATAVAGPHNHKRHSCWCAKLGYDFCSFELEYLVTLNTCQSAEWRPCTALICKHAEQASHQAEDRLNAGLATEVCLSNTHAVAKTNNLKDDPGIGRQSINPCHWNCNCASAKRMVGHEVSAKPR